MNLDELNVLFASAWSAEEKAQMFEGLVRGSNGLVAPESAPGPLRDANALGLKWREEAETFMRKAEEGGKKSAAARASRFGTSQPPSGNSRTPFEESSNQATSYKLQAENNKQQGDLASLDAGMSPEEQQPESEASPSTGSSHSQALAQTPDQPLSSRATPLPPSGATPSPRRSAPTFEIPASLQYPRFLEAWAEWLEFRRKDLKKPVTEMAGNKQLASLAAVGPDAAVAAINVSISSGYTGLFPKPLSGRTIPAPPIAPRKVNLL